MQCTTVRSIQRNTCITSPSRSRRCGVFMHPILPIRSLYSSSYSSSSSSAATSFPFVSSSSLSSSSRTERPTPQLRVHVHNSHPVLSTILTPASRFLGHSRHLSRPFVPPHAAPPRAVLHLCDSGRFSRLSSPRPEFRARTLLRANASQRPSPQRTPSYWGS
jgi:hypothetical protein